MTFEEMSPLQRRLHNAALVLEAEGDDHGFAKLQRDAIEALQPNTQEPTHYVDDHGLLYTAERVRFLGIAMGVMQPLYTHPAHSKCRSLCCISHVYALRGKMMWFGLRGRHVAKKVRSHMSERHYCTTGSAKYADCMQSKSTTYE